MRKSAPMTAWFDKACRKGGEILHSLTLSYASIARRWLTVTRMNTTGAEKKLTLFLLNDKFTISKLAQFAELPMIVAKGEMCFSARTDEELVIITPEFMAPNNVQQETGFRAIRVEGESSLKDTRVISALIDPLTAAGIGTVVWTTFNSVYVFLREEKIVDAVKALQHAGHTFEHKEVMAPK